MAINEGQVAQAARRDSPWWLGGAWVRTDADLREVAASGIEYDPAPLADVEPDGLYMLYGPRRVGKTVAVKQAVRGLLTSGVEPLRIVRVTVDGWPANRLGLLYDHVTRVLTSSVGEAPRYWFIDEVTSCTGPWWTVLKNLRDNTWFGRDCVVLTGSSNRGLDEAIKAFAGRRGEAAAPDRVLLPMTFADYCRCMGVGAPDVDALRPDELTSERAREVWLSLGLHADALIAAWQAYLQTGGYPRAVGDWRRSNNIRRSTCQALWDVVRGDALSSGMSEAVLAAVMEGIDRRLGSLTEIVGFAEEVGVGRDALASRLAALIGAFLVWVCPRADADGRADRRKQEKLYFLDPLLARLPELIHGKDTVDVTRLSEQQLGVSLLQWNERAAPGSIRSGGDWVTHHRGKGGGEIDFAGVCPDTLTRATPIESKYVSGSWRRHSLGLRNSTLGHGILATRDVLDVPAGEPVWAVPASLIAYALSQPT